MPRHRPLSAPLPGGSVALAQPQQPARSTVELRMRERVIDDMRNEAPELLQHLTDSGQLDSIA